MQINNKVSVIVPVYNTAVYIEECLLSILYQTYKNIEVIVVDDASDDQTSVILEKFNDRIHVIRHIKNGGPGKARNTGMDHASGDLTVFVDSDDYLSSKTIIEDIVRIFSGDIYIFNGQGFNVKSEIIEKRYFGLEQKYFNKKGIYKKYYHLIFNIMSPAMKVYSSEFLRINNIRFPEGIYGEDVEFWIKCLLVTKKIRYVDLYAYHRRRRENSIMMSGSVKNIKDRIDNLDSLLNLTSENVVLYNYVVKNYISWIAYLIHQKNDPDLFLYMETKMDWLMKKYNN
jgi:glycosyltransferase involved in cell wall biosynthesis